MPVEFDGTSLNLARKYISMCVSTVAHIELSATASTFIWHKRDETNPVDVIKFYFWEL